MRDYYDSILQALIIDLRIFTGSNVVAGLAALGLLFSSHFRGLRKVEIFSMFIFASVVVSTRLYIDGLTFYRILLNWHMGWWYPIGVSITSVDLYREYAPKEEGRKEQQGR